MRFFGCWQIHGKMHVSSETMTSPSMDSGAQDQRSCSSFARIFQVVRPDMPDGDGGQMPENGDRPDGSVGTPPRID